MAMDGFAFTPEAKSPESSQRRTYQERIGNTTVRFEIDPLDEIDRTHLKEEDPNIRYGKLVSLKAYSFKTGDFYDVYKHVNPRDIPTYVALNGAKNFHQMSIEGESQYVTTPFLEDSLNVATCLHELGHAAQTVDPATNQLYNEYHHTYNAFTETTTREGKLAFFSYAEKIINLSPSLEKYRDQIETGRAKQEQVSKVKAHWNYSEVEKSTWRHELATQQDRCIELVHADLGRTLPTLEAIFSTYQTQTRGNLQAEEWLEQELSMYGIHFFVAPVTEAMFKVFCEWVRNPLRTDPNRQCSISIPPPPSKIDFGLYSLDGDPYFSVTFDEKFLAFTHNSATYTELRDAYQEAKEGLLKASKMQNELLFEERRLAAEARDSLREVLDYPKKELERNAWWRAIRWMRELYDQHGIDFLQDGTNELKDLMKRVTKCLDSYEAKTERSKKVFGSSSKKWVST